MGCSFRDLRPSAAIARQAGSPPRIPDSAGMIVNTTRYYTKFNPQVLIIHESYGTLLLVFTRRGSRNTGGPAFARIASGPPGIRCRKLSGIQHSLPGRRHLIRTSPLACHMRNPRTMTRGAAAGHRDRRHERRASMNRRSFSVTCLCGALTGFFRPRTVRAAAPPPVSGEVSLLKRRQIEALIAVPIIRGYEGELGVDRAREKAAGVIRDLALKAGRADSRQDGRAYDPIPGSSCQGDVVWRKCVDHRGPGGDGGKVLLPCDPLRLCRPVWRTRD